MIKRFIRFIVNTEDHPAGEKIKAINIITKECAASGRVLEVKKPYIKAGQHQVEIDIEGDDYRAYLPLRNFKRNGSMIIKKSDDEIRVMETKRAEDKKRVEDIQTEKKIAKSNAEKVINDDDASDKDKLQALLTLYKGEA